MQNIHNILFILIELQYYIIQWNNVYQFGGRHLSKFTWLSI